MAKVLVVDDSPIIQRLISGILKKGMHDVVAVAQDGNDAAAKFEQHRPDLTLMDVTMPNCDGREGLRKILEIAPAAKVLMLSALIEPEVTEQCLRMGAKFFLSKDLINSPDLLLQKVTEALSGMESAA